MEYLVNATRKTDKGTQTCTMILKRDPQTTRLADVMLEANTWYSAVIACDGTWETTQSGFNTRNFSETESVDNVSAPQTKVQVTAKALNTTLSSYLQFEYVVTNRTLLQEFTAFLTALTDGAAGVNDYIIKSILIMG